VLPPPPPNGDEGAALPPVEQPARRSGWPIVAALVLTVLVVAGGIAVMAWARTSGGCEPGDFRSVRFGYCARTPEGWTAASARGDASSLDRFLLPDGAALITVTAVPLSRGQDLTRIEQFVRGYAEDAGARPGASSPVQVDGVEGLSFDVSHEGPDGVVRSREVLFARDGVAWRVTLADGSVGFEASTRRLDELLESWTFT
jgi:hypothetical protein